MYVGNYLSFLYLLSILLITLINDSNVKKWKTGVRQANTILAFLDLNLSDEEDGIFNYKLVVYYYEAAD